MDLIQLKMPPDRAAAVADAIERDMKARPDEATTAELEPTLAWLRFRVTKFNQARAQFTAG